MINHDADDSAEPHQHRDIDATGIIAGNLTDPDTADVVDAAGPAMTDTPVFDATVQALAATQSATDALADSACGASEHTNTTTATGDTRGSDETDWLDQWYGDPATSPPVIDPDTPEGAAILSLFSRIKDIEHSDGTWPAGDLVTVVTEWFNELGIDPDERPGGVGRRLRLALRERPGGGLASSVYGVRIGTEHDDPEALIRTALHVLTRQLGPGTSIELVSHDRDLLTRIEHRIGPDPTPTTSS